MPGVAFRPAEELTTTIDPPLPASIIAGTAARTVWKVPVRLTLDYGVPLLVGQLPYPSPAEHARVGDQDVEAAELLDAVGDQLTQRRVVADVDLAGQDLATLGFDRVNRLRQIFWGGRRIGDAVGHRRADIQGNDVRTLARQPGRVRPPLAARGAGDECHPPLQMIRTRVAPFADCRSG